jgi:hypothetical protein
MCADCALLACDLRRTDIDRATGITMPPLRFKLLAVGFCACLIGCTGSGQSDPPAGASGPALAQPTSINGNYNGVKQLVTGAAMSCGTQDIFTLQVRNRAFHYVLNQPEVPWRQSVTFDVVITPDGSFHAGSGAAYIDGKASQGHMQGQIVGDACGYQFEADNVGSF